MRKLGIVDKGGCVSVVNFLIWISGKGWEDEVWVWEDGWMRGGLLGRG